MLELPDDNKPIERADKIYISRYEIRRSELGVAASNILVDLGFGKLTGETDSFGNPLIDPFLTGTVLNHQAGILFSRLYEAADAGKVTQDDVNAHIAALLALDAANQAGLEAFVRFCQQAEIITLPKRVLR